MEEKNTNKQENFEKVAEKKPNEKAGLYFSSHFKIHDPNTKEVFVKQRGDN